METNKNLLTDKGYYTMSEVGGDKFCDHTHRIDEHKRVGGKTVRRGSCTKCGRTIAQREYA